MDEEKLDEENNEVKERDLENNANGEMVQCDTCGTQIRKGNLSRHIKNVHQKIPRNTQNNRLYIKSTCDRCGKVFDCEDYMKKHQKYSCHSEKAFKCDKCDVAFKYSSSLADHKRITHDGITKIFSCEHCGKTFDRRTSLAVHIKYVHEKAEKNFKCDQCTSEFTISTQLKRHIKTVHQGIRDYMCSECGLSVVSAYSLKNHIAAVHRKERPYKCDTCDQTFGDKSAWLRHKKAFHDNIRYECKFCIKHFPWMGSLRKHLKNVHHCKEDEVRTLTSGKCRIEKKVA